MSTHLDLDDCAAQSELAVKELAELRDRVKELEMALEEIQNVDKLEHGILYLQDIAEKALKGSVTS